MRLIDPDALTAWWTVRDIRRMVDDTAGPFPLPNVSMPTWVVRFDENGVCTSPKTRAALLEAVRNPSCTDVIVFSHGWNNEFPHAMKLYGTFLAHFEASVASHPPTRAFTPLFVGFTWPSEWFVADPGPNLANDGAGPESRQRIIDAIVTRTPSNQRERVRALLGRNTLDTAEAKELAQTMVPFFDGVDDDEIGTKSATVDPATLLRVVQDMQRASSPQPQSDLEDFGTTTSGPGDSGPRSAGLLDVFDPRNFLRVFSTYQMKDRAGHVGWHGMAPLLRDLAKSPVKARLHAVGHSYGAKVMLSAICEPTPFNRPVESLLLLQPAISHLSFAAQIPGLDRAGGYRDALDPARLRPPIVTTYSANDWPLHTAFHLGMRRAADLGEVQIAAGGTSAGEPPSRYAALGGYGPRDAGQRLLDPMPSSGSAYPSLADQTMLGVDGSRFGRIKGHGDVATAETAWTLHQLMFRS